MVHTLVKGKVIAKLMKVYTKCVCYKKFTIFDALDLIEILLPLIMIKVIVCFSLCCSRICPFLGYCTYWNIMKDAIDMWTRPVR